MNDLPGAASLNHSSKRKAGGMEDQTTLPGPSVDISVPWESKPCSQEECLPCKRPKVESITPSSRFRRASFPVKPRCFTPQRPASAQFHLSNDTYSTVDKSPKMLESCRQLFANPSSPLVQAPLPIPKASDFVRHLGTAITVPSTIASVLPPINCESLAVLDLDNILRNLQLRHDLLFDLGVQFRAREKRRLTKRYWEAISRELLDGCTCATFDLELNLKPTICVCSEVDEGIPSMPTVYVAASFGLSTIRTPSRIRGLIAEFLHIVLQVIQPSSEVCDESLNGNDDSRTSKAGQTDQATILRSHIDVEFIYQQICWDVFDPKGLMTLIGQAMKTHCAPIRDASIDAMVAAARSGEKVTFLKSLQTALEILEQMKMDIANHQLKIMQPLLLESAAQFERRNFLSRQRSSNFNLTATHKWLQDSHAACIAAESCANQRIPGLPPYSQLRPNQQMQLCVITGLVNLIFHPPFHRNHAKSWTALRVSTSPQRRLHLQGCPETAYLDGDRIFNLSTDAADLMARYSLSMLYRTLASGNNHMRLPSTDAISRLMTEIAAIGPRHIGDCYLSSSTEEETGSESIATARANIILQIVRRATSATVTHSSPSLELPDKNALDLAERWIFTNLRTSSQVDRLFRNRLNAAISNHVVALIVTDPAFQPPSLQSLASITTSKKRMQLESSSGFEPFHEEIQQLVAKMARLCLIHLAVYGPIYDIIHHQI